MLNWKIYLQFSTTISYHSYSDYVYLIQNDHNPDVTSKSGFTPLHIASHYGNQSIANLLVQKGADVNYSAKHSITPLHVAAKWGKSNMVSLLLEQGAHIEAKTRDGLTPLHCAARSGHEQVVDMLLEKSAPISSKTKVSTVSSKIHIVCLFLLFKYSYSSFWVN